jgi:hypothetical protein
MKERLTQSQLAQVIAEVGQLSQRREAELDQEQVKQILQELNLSDDLLDDALVQIRRREALAAIAQRNLWIAAGVTVILVGAVAAITVFLQHRQQAIAHVSVYQSHITLSQYDGGNVAVLDRQANPKVYYHVTLNEVPLGEKLSLTCDWIDPSGKVAHQSRYQTREINNSVWSTYCYYQLNQGAATGSWKVQMSLDRPLSSTSFIVK